MFGIRYLERINLIARRSKGVSQGLHLIASRLQLNEEIQDNALGVCMTGYLVVAMPLTFYNHQMYSTYHSIELEPKM